MKTAKLFSNNKSNPMQVWLILLLISTIFLNFNLEVKGQGCIPLNGFNCTFSNPDAPNGVIRCGTIITASVHITGGIQVFSLTLGNYNTVKSFIKVK